MINRILNIVGWIGTALVIAAIGVRLALPSRDQYAYYLAWAGLVCMLAYTLSQWREIAGMFSRRQARYGTLTAVSILAVLGILTAINYIGKRQNKRWDLTAAKQFSLSDQSRNVLTKLDAPLQITAFAQDTSFQQYRDRLKEYEYGSKQVKTDYIDPEKKPAIAQQNKIEQIPTILLQYKGRSEKITSDSEQDITNGIIKVVTGEQKKVYFTQGHGEKDTAATTRESYGAIAAALKNENYNVDKLVLPQTSSVPDDASVVVIAGPRTDFFAPEVDALKKYLVKAGKLLLLLDPPDPGKPDVAFTNLTGLAHDWGIDLPNDIVVDASGMGRLFGAGPEVVTAANYPSHPITERFAILTAFPLARPVMPVSGGVNGHTAQTIVESSPRSWAEHDLKSLVAGEVSLDPSKGDKAGPVSLAAAVSATPSDSSKSDAKPEERKPETRVAVFGDSDFATNGALGIQGNRDLFMNAIGWLAQQENLISIRPKQPDDRRLSLTAAEQVNINWIALIIIPGLVFASGVYSWWRRR